MVNEKKPIKFIHTCSCGKETPPFENEDELNKYVIKEKWLIIKDGKCMLHKYCSECAGSKWLLSVANSVLLPNCEAVPVVYYNQRAEWTLCFTDTKGISHSLIFKDSSHSLIFKDSVKNRNCYLAIKLIVKNWPSFSNPIFKEEGALWLLSVAKSVVLDKYAFKIEKSKHFYYLYIKDQPPIPLLIPTNCVETKSKNHIETRIIDRWSLTVPRAVQSPIYEQIQWMAVQRPLPLGFNRKNIGGSMFIRPAEANGGREASVQMLPNGRLEFGPRYSPDIVAKAFWDSRKKIDKNIKNIRFVTGTNSDGTGGATVILWKKNSKIEYIGFEPDVKARQMWETISKMWPN